MNQASHAVLCHAALSFVATEAGHNNPRLGEAIGLRSDQLDRIQKLSVVALMKMAELSVGCIQLRFDPNVIDSLLGDVDAEIEQEELIETFVREGASRDMMAAIFGLNRRDFARIRRSMDVELAKGRIRELTPDEADRVFEVWQDLGGRHDPETYLALARSIELPLRVIWEELTKKYPDDDAALADLDCPEDEESWPRPIFQMAE
jgi:hypothetical protein